MEEVPSRFEQLWSIEQAAEYLAMSTEDPLRVAVPEVRAAELPAGQQGPLPARGSARLGRRPERAGCPEAASMGRQPLPIGSWGLIRTYPVGQDAKGKPDRLRAVADYRDFDGVVRRVEASGRTATQATQNLRQKLQNRTRPGRHGELTAMSRFSDAAELWLAKVDEMVADGRRSPGHGRHLPAAAEEPRAAGDGGGPARGGDDAAGRQGDRRDQGRRERRDRQELPKRHLGRDGPGGPVRRDHGTTRSARSSGSSHSRSVSLGR